MHCPFLGEARVGQCACAGSKLIPRLAGAACFENCSSEKYRECAVYLREPQADELAARCPYLQEPLMQYCSAAPVIKYIPYSESELSRCRMDSYRYCELYLALANAGHHAAGEWSGNVPLPSHLLYAANHMWFDPGQGDRWHVGIDAFFARVLGTVDRIRFTTAAGSRRPAAVISVRGLDLPVVFPYPLPVSSTHDHLRAKPELLTADPYGQGWLFEGTTTKLDGLRDATAAAEWMHDEVERVSEFVALQSSAEGPATCADGGLFAAGVLAQLSEERARQLFEQFFPAYASWEKHS